jgi:hypothetical protein
MAMSILTYIPGFSVKFFFQPIYTDYANNSSHLELRAGLSDTILKGTHPRTSPSWFGLIWFSGFRGKDLNVIFYQNIPNLHNRYKSAERKISQKRAGPWVCPFQNSVRQTRPQFKMAAVIKNRNFFNCPLLL